MCITLVVGFATRALITIKIPWLENDTTCDLHSPDSHKIAICVPPHSICKNKTFYLDTALSRVKMMFKYAARVYLECSKLYPLN